MGGVAAAELVRRDRSDGLLRLTLANPPVNLLQLPLLDLLRAEVEEAAADSRTRAVLLAGDGHFFSAGVDVRRLARAGQEEQAELIDALNAALLALYAFPKPLVAAVAGHATGGGLMLALCADYRVAGPRLRHGLPEVQLGLGFPVAAAEVIGATLAAHAAARLVLGGLLGTSEELLPAGVFDEVVEDPVARAEEVARARGAHPADAYAEIKAQLRAATVVRIEAALRVGDPLRERRLPPELAERVEAFLAGR